MIVTSFLGGHLFERAVVAGGDEGVVHRRVEAAARPIPGGEREIDDLEQLGPDPQRAPPVELRELRVGIEPREDALEAADLPLGLGHRAKRLGTRPRLQEELAVGAHGVEAATQHHEVLVVVIGGRWTMRTVGAGAA